MALVLFVAGCVTPASSPGPTPVVTNSSQAPTGSATTTLAHPSSPAAPSVFPPGIYYSAPASQPGPNSLLRLNGSLDVAIHPMPNGFDIVPSMVASTDSRSSILLDRPDGTRRTVGAQGIYHAGRPTLSSDLAFAAVQANEDPDAIGGNQAGADFNIYTVDLATGASHRISDAAYNEESPEWVPGTHLLAYSGFDPHGTGIDLHVFDTVQQREVGLFPGIGGLHVAASEDGKHLLESKRLRVYNLTSGSLESDLRQAALDGIHAAGYDVDAVHDGADHAGSFPLDGEFSPDAQSLVFDGAVVGHGTSGLLVMRIGVDGTQFRVLAGPVAVDPSRSNNDNYSQINPHWI